MPRIFLNVPKHLSKPTVPKSARKPPKVRSVVSAQVSSCQSDEYLYDETDACDSMDVDECTDVITLGTAPWLAVVQGSPTFDSWNVRASTIQVIFYKLEESGGVVYIEKAVVIRQDLATEVSSRGVLVPPCSYIEKDGNIPTLLTSQKNLTMFLRYIDALKICPGCKCELFPGISSSKAAMKRQGVWRNKKCMVLSGEHLCPPCKKKKKLW